MLKLTVASVYLKPPNSLMWKPHVPEQRHKVVALSNSYCGDHKIVTTHNLTTSSRLA